MFFDDFIDFLSSDFFGILVVLFVIYDIIRLSFHFCEPSEPCISDNNSVSPVDLDSPVIENIGFFENIEEDNRLI